MSESGVYLALPLLALFQDGYASLLGFYTTLLQVTHQLLVARTPSVPPCSPAGIFRRRAPIGYRAGLGHADMRCVRRRACVRAASTTYRMTAMSYICIATRWCLLRVVARH